MPETKTQAQLQKLIAQLDALYTDAHTLEKKFASLTGSVHPVFRKSALNLLHYLALRHHDIRELQEKLAVLGLSSLGRTESHVLASLQAVRRQLCFLGNCKPLRISPPLTFRTSAELIRKHTTELLGEQTPAGRNARIMVTFSTDLATDYELICRMLKAGMNCARINCAHDDKKIWKKMVDNIRKAEKEMEQPCKILFDLMGPKLRTGPLKPGPRLLAVHPVRDGMGRVISPATVWLSASGIRPVSTVDAELPVENDWLLQLQEGDLLYFHDTRGRKRKMSVVKREENGIIAHLFKTSYLTTGTTLRLKNKTALEKTARIGKLSEIEMPLLLKKDDLLLLQQDLIPGEPALYDAHGHVVAPAHISCTLPEIFNRVKVGQPILFDDGKIEGEIREVQENALLIKVTAAKDKGSYLRADKGINLPESKLVLNELTKKDKQDLAFVVKHADIVNLSFVNHPDTVLELQQELKKLKSEKLAVMLKIETKEGFRHLPHLLLAVMRSPQAGIMIARGDLAVECGWQRLAEVQEEVLWLCEAAHLPVVWATQVLETLAKKGRPSRAEITDAAMGQRADCVMLNKGPHIVQAIELLDDILKRMQQHQHKKTSMLRSLQVSELEHFYEEELQKG